MKYKVNDRVRIKSLDWYNENKDKKGNVYFEGGEVKPCFSHCMSIYCGQIMTISDTIGQLYDMIEDDGRFCWVDEMIESLAEDEMIDLTSIVMETVEEKTIQNALAYGYNLPEGYQFVDEDGNVINATKIVLEKKKKEYPKTFRECQECLGEDVPPMEEPDSKTHRRRQVHLLEVLLICRDAYWKIAGEEIGLGKPWEPDFTNDNEERYGIYIAANKAVKDFGGVGDVNTILTFPTEEMRDIFYENFKDLIMSCKELL